MFKAIASFFALFIPYFNAFANFGEAIEIGSATVKDMAQINRDQYRLESDKVTRELQASLDALNPTPTDK
jgi:hypothetical protein